MRAIEIFLLGSPRIEIGASPARLDTRKAIALLAYLVVTPGVQRRDALAGLLWPDSDQPRARAALRRTLSSLNRALNRVGLNIERETVGLDRSDGMWIDLAEFRRRISDSRAHPHSAVAACNECLVRLTEAVELYRGDFLAGLTLRDSSVFDDWQYAESEALRRDLAGALEGLVSIHTGRGEFERAIEFGRRWLSLDSLDEKVHRRLIQLYAWDGQRTAALRQYRECVRILDRELGVSPMDETVRQYQAIREDRPPPQPPALEGSPRLELPAAPPATTLHASSRRRGQPFVGRAVELADMVGAYESMRADGHLIVVEGEAGIGKTRLAQEFLSRVKAGGATVIAARCFQGEATLAYGPVVEALRSAVAPRADGGHPADEIPEHWLAEAARLLPELAPGGRDMADVPSLDRAGAQGRFFEAISGILLRVSRAGKPGVLFVDDLHWADQASLDLLTFIVRRLRGRPLLILATWRDEPAEATDRLRSLLGEARRAGTASSISLTRLSRSDVAELVHATGDPRESPSEGLEDRLYRETEGLPFFIVEFLEMRAGGEEPPDEARWEMPASVRDLLCSRLASVGDAGRQALETAATIGRSFDFPTLHKASGRREEEAVAALDGLMARGLVREVGGEAPGEAIVYDFAHEQLRALVYEETSLARRRLLHRRVAEAMAAHSGAPGARARHASRIAQHYRLAGRDRDASEHFKVAAEQSRDLFANVEAISHYNSALVLGHGDTAALNEAIGDLRTLVGEYGAAISSYETAASMCGPDALAGVENKLGRVYIRRGDWEIAASHFESALAGLGEGGPLGQRSRLHADLSLTAHNLGDAVAALDHASVALELGEVAIDTPGVAQAHNILGILARGRGELGEALRHLELSLDLAESMADGSARVAALNNLALVKWGAGQHDSAIKLAERALTLCESRGDRHREAALHNTLSDILHAAGRPEAAMAHLKRAVATFADIGEEAGAMQPEIWKLVEW